MWAEVSEKLSDVDPLIKYGAGDQDMLSILNVMSQKINDQELAEAAHLKIMDSDDDEDEFQEGPKFAELMAGRLAIVRMLEAIREVVPRMKGREQ